MNEKEERAYLRGEQALARTVIRDMVRCLDPNDPLRDTEVMSSELASARDAVRDLCDEMGIEIPDRLHLGDLVTKYLAPPALAARGADEWIEIPPEPKVRPNGPAPTYPYDNTPVLVSCSHGQYIATFYWDEEELNQGERVPDAGIAGWYVDDNKHGPFPLRGDAPTHYKPLGKEPMEKTR